MDQYAAWDIKVDDFNRHLEALKEETIAASDEAIYTALRVALDSAKNTTKFREQTGGLKDSLWIDQTHLATGAAGFLKADAKYASFVEYGTREHEIHARRAPMLRFFWEKLGTWAEFRSVHHPGTKPTFFMAEAGQKGGEYLERGLRLRFESAAAKFNRV